jgi:AcrR family transcriptional regulator
MARRAREGLHEVVLDAAREEFARTGLDRARVEDIARGARISKGAFYLHFRSKDEAFREIVTRFLGALEDHARRRHELEDRLASEPPARAVDVFEAECAIDVELLELLWRNRQIVSAVDGASREAHRGLLAGFRRRMHALVARRILDRQRAGDLRPDVDPDVIADVVVATYQDFARRMADMKARPDLEAWARSLLVVLQEGILERSAAAAPRRSRPPRR